MNRGLLELALSRMDTLKLSEKVFLAGTLETEADLRALSAGRASVLCQRSILSERWNPEAAITAAERDIQLLQRSGSSWVAWSSESYPPLLRELADPPVVLYYRGHLPNPEHALVAMVGTREPSPAGATAAFAMARDFGVRGVVVVSGLARGIDAFAHKGNLEGGTATIAVLGSSTDEVYPASNRALARRILDNGGALLSEYPPGTGPKKWQFPARNRIIAGLARALVVVEAPEKSGALISADFAMEQGRDLWVSAAGLASPMGAGCRRLVADGAQIAQSAEQVLTDWNVLRSDMPGQESTAIQDDASIQKDPAINRPSDAKSAAEFLVRDMECSLRKSSKTPPEASSASSQERVCQL